ncbi:hypothetical protein CH371_05920 [Leptospira wolffii]|uniref:OmpA-like domain-containing protein n=1 Tax=Leptospira wolffii TaxID=409998 RepID=A0A2M9ZHP6_9LEPT|nr:hypothetical protein CH371_05920 [Leptospira wolffii]
MRGLFRRQDGRDLKDSNFYLELLYILGVLVGGFFLYLLVPKKKPSVLPKSFPSSCTDLPISESVSFYFDAGSTEASPKVEDLRIIESWKRTDRTVEIRAWTDDTGSSANNRRLAKERAARAKRILENVGIPTNRILVSFQGVDPESIGNPNKFRFRRADCLLVSKPID